MFKYRIMNQDTCEVTTVDTIEEMFRFFKLNTDDFYEWKHLAAEEKLITLSDKFLGTYSIYERLLDNLVKHIIKYIIKYMEYKDVNAWIFINKKG